MNQNQITTAALAEMILADDELAWLPVARQVIAGEFDGADRSTRESVTIGLRNIRHPLCQQALKRLQWKSK